MRFAVAWAALRRTARLGKARPALLGVVALVALALAGAPACAEEPGGGDPSPVTLTGWLNVAYGGPLVRLSLYVEDEDRSIDLDIDASVLEHAGGIASLDRRRVQVTGAYVDDPPETLRVTSIVPVP